MAKKVNFIAPECNKVGTCIYEMPKAIVENFIDKDCPKSLAYSQEFLCAYVNSELGLLHKCIHVNIR